MITPDEQLRVDQFLRITEHSSLLEYLSLAEDTPLEESQRRVSERRRWAQAQQANPRYRDESLWLLRNGSLFERLLVDEQAEYRQSLSVAPESAPPVPGPASTFQEFPDHYATLGLGPSASMAEIETAHRSRYRWARSLRDREKAEQLYDQIAAAWNTLSHPSRRASYDVAYRDHVGLGPEWEDDTGVERRALALLGPPESAPPEPSSTPPAQPALTRHSQLRRRAPGDPRQRMIVRGRWPRSVHTGRSPARLWLELQLGGSAPIWVTVSETRPWLEAQTDRFLLEPDGHRLLLTVDPAKMERNKGTGRVVLEAANGEREDLIIHARRGWLSGRRIGLFLMFLLSLIALGQATGTLPLELFFGSPVATSQPSSTILKVVTDPGADSIWVDGKNVGSGPSLNLGPNLPRGRSFRLEARMEGFKPKSQTLSIREGTTRQILMVLQLEQPLDFQPKPSMRSPSPTSAVAEAALKTIQTADQPIAQCMRSVATPHPSSGLQALIHLAPDGYVAGVEFQTPDLDGTPVAGCIKRQLRALRTPTFSGDFLTVDYKLSDEDAEQRGAP
ncbi:MAG: DnaJ domain-containing protein [Myxococcota bacterium]|nr:DnaJ domain-containing protein [Myxococcota bacterium]